MKSQSKNAGGRKSGSIPIILIANLRQSKVQQGVRIMSRTLQPPTSVQELTINLSKNPRLRGMNQAIIFDALRLVLTNQSKSRKELLRPCIKTSKYGRSHRGPHFKANSTPDCPSSVTGFFFTFQHQNVNASRKTTPTDGPHRKPLEMKPFFHFSLGSRDFSITDGPAHAELLCVCC